VAGLKTITEDLVLRLLLPSIDLRVPNDWTQRVEF